MEDNKDGARILLADDDRTHCLVLSSALRRRGYVVYVAHTLEDAFSEAELWRPDYAVVDLRMGDKSGLELVERLADALPGTTSVVLTGYGSIATAVSAIKKGAVQYLTKPVGIDELLAALEGRTLAATTTETPALDQVEWEHLQRVLAEAGGNVSEAARRLNMHRRTLQRKLARGRSG